MMRGFNVFNLSTIIAQLQINNYDDFNWCTKDLLMKESM